MNDWMYESLNLPTRLIISRSFIEECRQKHRFDECAVVKLQPVRTKEDEECNF